MENDYRFLTDHSYSMIDYDTISLQQRAMKSQTASIDRSSSDKENNVSNTIKTSNTVKNKIKSSAKKKSVRSNLATNSRTQFKKKQTTKNLSKNGNKSLPGNNIKKKASVISKLSISHSIDTVDSTPILSIEERVKLRRTKPLAMAPIKPALNKKPQVNPKKHNNISKTNQHIIKSKKYFLGSGLDLDNIVLGNRQRRSMKT